MSWVEEHHPDCTVLRPYPMPEWQEFCTCPAGWPRKRPITRGTRGSAGPTDHPAAAESAGEPKAAMMKMKRLRMSCSFHLTAAPPLTGRQSRVGGRSGAVNDQRQGGRNLMRDAENWGMVQDTMRAVARLEVAIHAIADHFGIEIPEAQEPPWPQVARWARYQQVAPTEPGREEDETA